jgi:hypothetical protein
MNSQSQTWICGDGDTVADMVRCWLVKTWTSRYGFVMKWTFRGNRELWSSGHLDTVTLKHVGN